MAKERKYLDEFEMSLLEKYGIKILKKKYDIGDLISMLPKKWNFEDYEFGHKTVQKHFFELHFDGYEWRCASPVWYYSGACIKTVNFESRGETVLQCLLDAVLRLAKDPIGRRYLSKTYVVEDWRYEPDKSKEKDDKLD